MKTLLLLLSLACICGCKEAAQQSHQTSSNDIKVELLFIHEGVKVYRFNDGRTVYYTDARGKTAWEETHSNHHSVDTAQ